MYNLVSEELKKRKNSDKIFSYMFAAFLLCPLHLRSVKVLCAFKKYLF